MGTLTARRGATGDADAEAEAGAFRNFEVFEVLSDRCLDSSYRLASVVLRDEAEAQDVVHGAVLVAWRRFGSLREVDRFDAWFGRIVLNLCRDRLRSRRRSRIRELARGGVMESRRPDDIARVAERDAIGTAFARLDPDLQMVVALRYYRDLSVLAPGAVDWSNLNRVDGIDLSWLFQLAAVASTGIAAGLLGGLRRPEVSVADADHRQAGEAQSGAVA